MKNNSTDNREKPYTSTVADVSLGFSRINDVSAIGETLHSKIEPLIGVQSALVESVSGLTKITEPLREHAVQLGSMVNPVAGSIESLGNNLAEIGKTAINTGDLLKAPTYDFLNSPMASALNASADAIKIGQERLTAVLPSLTVGINASDLGVANQVSQISALNNIAIDSLQSSPILYPVSKPDERISDLSEKIQTLESKIVHLGEKNKNLFLTDITSNIIAILEDLDDDIVACFKGAMATLLEAKSEDMVGQVAESLTRVIERLPFSLSRKSVPSKINKDNVCDAISSLKGISKGEIEHLVEQQYYFYSTLGSIRHRNKRIYNLYNSDHSRFKALAVQAEAYIYILLTFKNEK